MLSHRHVVPCLAWCGVVLGDQLERKPISEDEFIDSLAACPRTYAEDRDKFRVRRSWYWAWGFVVQWLMLPGLQEFTEDITGLYATRVKVEKAIKGDDEDDKKKKGGKKKK